MQKQEQKVKIMLGEMKLQVKLIDHMGSDLSVVNAARVSFAKESEWESIPEGGAAFAFSLNNSQSASTSLVLLSRSPLKQCNKNIWFFHKTCILNGIGLVH